MTPRWDTLDSALAGEVARPGSPAYETTTQPFNARFHHLRPQAIVLCRTPDDVAETISFVARHDLEIVPRSGGHCFAGHSSTQGVVVDVSPMHAVAVEDGVVTVGAGARLGPVYDALQEHGLAIAAGTCPTVGIAGLTLGGGLGILGRTYGLTSDRLVGAQIVLADGRVLQADEHHHEDLFWALRGAGAGNFGVVTSLAFAPVPAPEMTNVHLSWRYDRAPAVVEAWQAWAPTAPDGLHGSLKITTTGDVDRLPEVNVYAAFMGRGEADAPALVDALVGRVGTEPISASIERLSFPQTRQFWAQLPTADQGQGDDVAEDRPLWFLSKSEYFAQPLPGEAIAGLMDVFTQARLAGDTRELDFMPWGGAYNRVSARATAFAHRDQLFQLKHAAVVDPRAPMTSREAAQRHVDRSWAAVHPWGSSRVFPNFPDPDLADWAEAYYGENYDRLRQVKQRYDPDVVFRFPQSLPAG